MNAMLDITQQKIGQADWTPSDWNLWSQWVLANSVGEVVGLGLAAATAAGWVLTVGEPKTALAALALAGVMILIGTGEGVIVGLAQWLVLRHRLHHLRRRDWVMATALGALVAWTLGMLPSTLMAMNESAGSSPPPEMSDALTYLLAATMGSVLGPILGIPQWRVLRRHLPRASFWIWANAAAWMVGMPVVFIGARAASSGAAALSVVVTGVATIAIAGAVVGAIHGLALLWLLRRQQDEKP